MITPSLLPACPSQSLKIGKDISNKYDTFDLENSVPATEFLLASLNPELQRRIKRISEPGDIFPIVWLRLIDLLVSISLRHHDDICEKVRKCSPSDYSQQENLETIIDDLKISVEELICANQFDVALMYTSLNKFLRSAVSKESSSIISLSRCKRSATS